MAIHEAGPADGVREDQLILVDRNNRALGSLGKTAVHERGLRHRAFSIFLVDPRGRMLLQRRHPSKYHSGGLWANTCCGHPRWGERMMRAARRRLDEELGMTAPLQLGFRTHYDARLENGLVENEEVTVFFGPCRETPRPDPTEITETRFVSLDELNDELRAEPSNFAVWLHHYVTKHPAELATGVLRASSA
jgi:isopentenyl-diphosphate delta-isomerase